LFVYNIISEVFHILRPELVRSSSGKLCTYNTDSYMHTKLTVIYIKTDNYVHTTLTVIYTKH